MRLVALLLSGTLAAAQTGRQPWSTAKALPWSAGPSAPAEALPRLLARLETLGSLEGPRPDPAGTGERILILFW